MIYLIALSLMGWMVAIAKLAIAQDQSQESVLIPVRISENNPLISPNLRQRR
jgi:hypothetical protein